MTRCVSLGASAMPRLPLLPHHEYTVELDDGLASLVEPARPQAHEAEPRSTPGFPDLRDFRLRVERVPVEDRPGEPDVVQADLEPVAARHVDEEARRDRDGQEAVHDPPPAEWLSGKGAPRIILVEVDLIRVPGQEREPDVVRLRDGPPGLAPDLRPDPDVLEERPVLVHGNRYLYFWCFQGRAASVRKIERYMGPASDPDARRRTLREIETYAARASAELAERMAAWRRELARP